MSIHSFIHSQQQARLGCTRTVLYNSTVQGNVTWFLVLVQSVRWAESRCAVSAAARAGGSLLVFLIRSSLCALRVGWHAVRRSVWSSRIWG